MTWGFIIACHVILHKMCLLLSEKNGSNNPSPLIGKKKTHQKCNSWVQLKGGQSNYHIRSSMAATIIVCIPPSKCGCQLYSNWDTPLVGRCRSSRLLYPQASVTSIHISWKIKWRDHQYRHSWTTKSIEKEKGMDKRMLSIKNWSATLKAHTEINTTDTRNHIKPPIHSSKYMRSRSNWGTFLFNQNDKIQNCRTDLLIFLHPQKHCEETTRDSNHYSSISAKKI